MVVGGGVTLRDRLTMARRTVSMQLGSKRYEMGHFASRLVLLCLLAIVADVLLDFGQPAQQRITRVMKRPYTRDRVS